MKTKFILPLVVAAAFVACSDDSSSTAPVNPDPALSSDALPTDLGSSSDMAVIDPTSSSDMLLPELSSSSVLPDVPLSSSATPSVGGIDPVPPAVDGPYDATKKYTFYGAELTGKEQFKYGRFEARMKMAATGGTVSSMFLNYDLSWKKGDEPWNEIDIEVLGKDPNSWQSNIITREADPSISGTTSSEKIHAFGFDATNEFHLYAIIWTPDYVAWEIDSVEVRRVAVGELVGSHADADQVKFLTEEQSLRFNLWASKSASWTGKWTPENLPVEQHIDYVRVYAYNADTKGFTLSWQDDFEGDALDYSRWSEGNWEMERVMYRDLNIRVENGYAKLRLDYEL
jgi:hypothetical protein